MGSGMRANSRLTASMIAHTRAAEPKENPISRNTGNAAALNDLSATVKTFIIDVATGPSPEQEAATAFHLASLDTPGGPDGEQAVQIGTTDSEVQAVEARLVIEPMVRRLSPREQAILRLRFVDRMSQSQIARELHISQMHVSRLLNRSLSLMRSWLDEA